MKVMSYLVYAPLLQERQIFFNLMYLLAGTRFKTERASGI